MTNFGESDQLTHVDSRGVARMVDVTGKNVTARSATATGSVTMSEAARRALAAGELAKGDALAVARVAGIAAAKRTPDLIPLCHPIAIGAVSVEVVPSTEGVAIEATVASADRTGVEMEALTCVSVAALTVLDMVKAVDRSAVIGPTRVTAKTGGRSGDWRLGPDGKLTRSGNGSVDGLDCAVADATAAGALAEVQAAEAERAARGVPSPAEARDNAGPLTGRRALVVTVSDRRAAGTAEDTTGPVAAAALQAWGADVRAVVVPDDEIVVRRVAGEAIRENAALVLTTGGTGIGPRDVTPEALAPLIQRRLPGVEQAVRQASGNPAAVLSRALVGVVGHTMIVALPGSPAAVREGLGVIRPIMRHVIGQLAGQDHDAEGSSRRATNVAPIDRAEPTDPQAVPIDRAEPTDPQAPRSEGRSQ